ncbi:MAG TPA: CAP domain-containing protein [Chitinophagaceae bacterium]|nr:CAP domain-containing protein [Chitinophagaceae bacterium]
MNQPLFNSLDKSEKELLYWVNLMRKDPVAFKDKYVLPFLEQFPEAQSQDSRTLVRRMSSLPTLPQLLLSPVLTRTAGDHAQYLADKKMISHTGRGGKGFGARMADAGVSGCAGENIFDGQDDGLMVLILLLIDTGVPGTGHREALLNPQFTTTGIGVSSMDDQRMVFVQQFGCK